MNPTTQQRFRPLIGQRLAAVEQRLRETDARVEISGASGTNAVPVVVAPSESEAAAALRSEHMRLRNALQRIDAGTYGRCMRCGCNLPEARLEQEPDAVTCDPCKSRRRGSESRA